MKNYGIKDDYLIQESPTAFDDTPFKDEFQKEVYKRAAFSAFGRHDIRTVVDVGCGSGYKLLLHFQHLRTVGVELEPTLTFLRENYPEREWRAPEEFVEPVPYSMVICSDVIEHVTDPDALLEYIISLRPSLVILSTPDREALGLGTENGPPRNQTHIREWTRDEFHRYIAQRFDLRYVGAGKTIIIEATTKETV